MTYLAKPYLNTKRGARLFETKRKAVKYLQTFTGYIEMYAQDWELVGKLTEVVPATVHHLLRTKQIHRGQLPNEWRKDLPEEMKEVA